MLCVGGAAREEGIERFAELAAFHLRGVHRRIVEPAVVGELALAIEEVEIGRAHGVEGAGRLLGLVVEVGKSIAALASALLHVVEAVLGVRGGVVDGDGDEAKAFVAVIFLELE